MANDSSSIAFFAAEVLEKTAQRHPRKTAIITKDEELTFADEPADSWTGGKPATGGHSPRRSRRSSFAQLRCDPAQLLRDAKDRRGDGHFGRSAQGKRAAGGA